MKRRSPALAAVALAALSACGSQSAGTPAGDTSAGPVETAAAPSVTATAETTIAAPESTAAPDSTVVTTPAWVSENGILTVGWLPEGYEVTPIQMTITPASGPTSYGVELRRFGDLDKYEFVEVSVKYGAGATAVLDDPEKGLAAAPGGYTTRTDLLPDRTVYVTAYGEQTFMSWIAGPDLAMSVTGTNASESTMVEIAKSIVFKGAPS
jgi:hypothetical protein